MVDGFFNCKKGKKLANTDINSPVLLFDGVCNLCNASVQWVQTYLGETQALLEATQGLRTSLHDRIRCLVELVGQSLRQEQDVPAVQCNKAE